MLHVENAVYLKDYQITVFLMMEVLILLILSRQFLTTHVQLYLN